MALLDKLKKEGTTLTPLRGTLPTSTLVKDVIQVNKKTVVNTAFEKRGEIPSFFVINIE